MPYTSVFLLTLFVLYNAISLPGQVVIGPKGNQAPEINRAAAVAGPEDTVVTPSPAKVGAEDVSVVLSYRKAFASGDFHTENRAWGGAEDLGGFSLGVHIPMTPGNPLGIHLEAGLLAGRMAGFSDRTDALSEAYSELSDFDDSELTEFSTSRERYWFVPLSAGFGFEDNYGNVGVFARLSLTASVNSGGGTVTGENGMRFSAKPPDISFGHSLEFGLIFSERLRISAAWHDLGRISYAYDSPSPRISGQSVAFSQARYIQNGAEHSFRARFLEFRLGYTLGQKGR